MTEYEWLTCENLTAMFSYIENSDKASQFAWFIWHRSPIWHRSTGTGRGDLVWKQPDDVTSSTVYDITEQHACDLVREIVGNPFHAILLGYPEDGLIGINLAPRANKVDWFEPSWLTPSICTFAQNIIDSGDYDSVDVLADMLEESGCDNEEVLHHLRREVKDACPCNHMETFGCWDCQNTGFLGWIPKPVPCQPGCWVLRLLTEYNKGEIV